MLDFVMLVVIAALCVGILVALALDERERRQDRAAWKALGQRLAADRRAREEAKDDLMAWFVASLPAAKREETRRMSASSRDFVLYRARPLIERDRTITESRRAILLAAWERLYGEHNDRVT